MTKFTIGVLVGAVGVIGFMVIYFLLQTEEITMPYTVEGYLSDEEQTEFENRQANPILFLEESQEARKALFKSAPYDELILANGSEEIQLKREGEGDDGWQIANSGTPVEKNRIKAILDLFATDIGLMPVRTVREGNTALLADYGLHGKRLIRISLKKAGKTRVSLHVGDRDKKATQGQQQGGQDTYDTFVSVPEHPNQIYRAKQRDLRSPLDIKLGDLRSKEVFAFKFNDIAKVVIEDPQATAAKRIVLKATWTQPATDEKPTTTEANPPKAGPVATFEIIEPVVPDFKLTNLKSYWSSIANLRASEFIIGAKPTDDTGLIATDDAARIVITRTGDTPQEVTLVLGSAKEKDKLFYAQVLGTNEYMVLSKYALENLVKSLDDLRDKNVLAVEKKEDITRIAIQNEHTGDSPMVFERRGTDWHMTAPMDQRPSQSEVKGLVSGLQYLRVADFLSSRPDDEQSGLTKPSVTVKASIKGQERVLRFGAERDSKVTAHLEGTSLYFNVSSWTKNKFNKNPTDFRNKMVLELNGQDIQALTLTHSDQTVSLERIEGETSKWRMTAPEDRTAANGLQDVTVNGIVNTVKQFSIKAFTDKTLTQAGLKTPAFTLRATLRDGTTRNIVVSEQGQNNQRYVRVDSPSGNANAVYLVDEPKLQNIQKRSTDLTRTDG